MRNSLAGILLIILGLGLIALGVFTLIEPLFKTGFPLFLGAIAAGCCAIGMGFSVLRARVWAAPFIFLTVLTAGAFFIWGGISVIF